MEELESRLYSDGFMRIIAGAIGFCAGFFWWIIFYLLGDFMWPAGGRMPGTLLGFLYVAGLMFGVAIWLTDFVFRLVHAALYAKFIAPPPPPPQERSTEDENEEEE